MANIADCRRKSLDRALLLGFTSHHADKNACVLEVRRHANFSNRDQPFDPRILQLAGHHGADFMPNLLGDTFRVKGVGMIAGCYVVDGVLKRDGDVRVLRDGVVIYTGKISSLRRFKDDVNEVRSGFECGASVSNFNDVKVGDVLECFHMQKLVLAEATA